MAAYGATSPFTVASAKVGFPPPDCAFPIRIGIGRIAPKGAVELGIAGFSRPTRRDNGRPRRETAPRNETALPSIEEPRRTRRRRNGS
jgi:hypothetical protein